MEVDSPLSDVFSTSADPLTDPQQTVTSPSRPEEKPLEENVPSKPVDLPDKNVLSAVLQICRKYNLKVNLHLIMVPYFFYEMLSFWHTVLLQKTEEAFKTEVNVTSDMVSMGNESEVNKLLSAYKSEGNPDVYKDTYADLMKFVENSLDIYKVSYIYSISSSKFDFIGSWEVKTRVV